MKEYTSIKSNADRHMRRPSNSGLSRGDDLPEHQELRIVSRIRGQKRSLESQADVELRMEH